MDDDKDVLLFLSNLFQRDFLNRSFVPQMTLLPWFYVETDVSFRGARERAMLMIATYDCLKDILSLQSKQFRVLSILYMTPGFMNKTQHWKMELLLEAIETDDGGERVPYFKVEGGVFYSGIGPCEQPKLRSCRVVFRAIKRGKEAGQTTGYEAATEAGRIHPA